MEAPTKALRLSDRPWEISSLCRSPACKTAVRGRTDHHVASEKLLPLEYNPNSRQRVNQRFQSLAAFPAG